MSRSRPKTSTDRVRFIFAAADENPPRYRSVSAIFGTGLRLRGHDVPGVFYAGGMGGESWAGGAAATVPRPRRSPPGAILTSLAREAIALDGAFRRFAP